MASTGSPWRARKPAERAGDGRLARPALAHEGHSHPPKLPNPRLPRAAGVRSGPVEVAILLFDGVTALDAVGPYEVLRFLPGTETRFVAAERGLKRAAPGHDHETDAGPGALALMADYTLEEVPHPDVVLVPGGPGEEQARQDPEVLAWLREAHRTVALDDLGVHRGAYAGGGGAARRCGRHHPLGLAR